MSDKKNKSKPKKPTGRGSSPLQLVWKNPDDGTEHGLDVSICTEFGCLILGAVDDPRVQHHMTRAHGKPSGILSEVGIQRMAAQGHPIVLGQTVTLMQQGIIR